MPDSIAKMGTRFICCTSIQKCRNEDESGYSHSHSFDGFYLMATQINIILGLNLTYFLFNFHPLYAQTGDEGG